MAARKKSRKNATKKAGNTPVVRLENPGWTKLLSKLRIVSTSDARADFADVTDIAKYKNASA